MILMKLSLFILRISIRIVSQTGSKHLQNDHFLSLINQIVHNGKEGKEKIRQHTHKTH